MPHRRSRADRLGLPVRSRSVRPQVEVVEDRVLLVTFTVTNNFDNGDNLNPVRGSLRQAILNANSPSSPGLDLINFNIFNSIGGVVQTIAPLSPLPTITDPVIIDGTTQPGFAGTPIIELDGTNAGQNVDGLTIIAGGSTVRGLVINRFRTDPTSAVGGNGILLQTNGGNAIEGNFIGTNATGAAVLGNGRHGVFILDALSNTVGGPAPGARNVISGNLRLGVLIAGGGATGNVVAGNYIGTDAAGTLDLGNNFEGVAIQDSPGNTVGGTVAGASNLISANHLSGVIITDGNATDNVVVGNFIGTDITGTRDLGNRVDGIFILDGASGNTVGGTADGARNVISGNDRNGVFIGSGDLMRRPATRNLVAGNFIGTDAAGTDALGNGTQGDIEFSDGVRIENAPDNTVGGIVAGARNLISGNLRAGVLIAALGATRNLVAGNYIGTDVAGVARLGNLDVGLSIVEAPGNTVGGTAAGAGNLISSNGAGGVFIGIGNATRNLLAGNFIGTDVSGSADLGNGGDGVQILDAPGNMIGGTAPGSGNVISGNGDAQNESAGININGRLATGNRVQGNRIGTDAAGTRALGNSFHGVFVSAPGNLIGGIEPGAGNVISANGFRRLGGEDGVGIYLFGGGGNTIQGNLIGTDATGTRDLGNSKIGVLVSDSPGNTIGGTSPATRNIISGNGLIGLDLAGAGATGNVVQGNFIGVDVSGLQRLGNGIPDNGNQQDGIGVFLNNAPGNLIGGAGAGNVISGNLSVGVQFLGSGTIGNRVQGNLIGTDATAAVALGNVLDGIFLDDAPGNFIGGRQGEGNVISGNGGNGLHLNGSGSTGNVVQGNRIGLGSSGTRSLPNGQFGVLLNAGAAGNTVVLPPAANANRIGPNTLGDLRNVDLDQSGGTAASRRRARREAIAQRRRLRRARHFAGRPMLALQRRGLIRAT
jgi:hypothetical protein